MKSYYNSYIGRIVNALSQLGNAITGGNPDITISARIGQKQKSNLYWKITQAVVDFTFYPIDGKGHCDRAYASDANEDFTEPHIGKGNIYGFIILTLLVSLSCILIMPGTWVYQLVKELRKR